MSCLWEAWMEAQETDIVCLETMDGDLLKLPKELPATKKLVEEMLMYPVAGRDRWIARPFFTSPTSTEERSRCLRDYLRRAKDKFQHIFKTETEAWTRNLNR